MESGIGCKRMPSQGLSIEINTGEKKARSYEYKNSTTRCSLSTLHVPGRASLSENWTKDKTQRNETSTEQTSCSLPREDRVGCKRTPSLALPIEIDRGEKKARSDENKNSTTEFYAGPTFMKSPAPSELPMPWFVKSPDPIQVPIPRFLYATEKIEKK